MTVGLKPSSGQSLGLKLASSTFTAGPKDDLAAPDIYKTDAKSIISSIPISAKDVKDLFASISMKNGQFDILGTVGKLSKTQLGDNLTNLAKEMGTNVRELGNGVVGQATTLLAKTGIDAQAMMCTVGEYANKVDIKSIGSVLAIGKAVSSVTNVSQALNVASKAYSTGIFSGIVSEASNSGVAGVFTQIKDKITENGVLVNVAKAAMPFVLSNTDTRLLREITNSGIGRAVNDIVPGFTVAFSQVYNPRQGYSLSKIDSFESIIKSFNEIDSAWDKAKQGGADISSIFGILSGTKAFRNMIYTGVSYTIASIEDNQRKAKLQDMALASIYRKTTVGELLKKYFPSVPMLGSYQTKLPQEDTFDLKTIDRAARILLA